MLGPASGPPRTSATCVHRLADDRPLRERARLVAEQRSAARSSRGGGGGPLRGRRCSPAPSPADEVARALGQVTARSDGGPRRPGGGPDLAAAVASSTSLTTSSPWPGARSPGGGEALAAPRPRLRPAGRRRRARRPRACSWARRMSPTPGGRSSQPARAGGDDLSAGLETVAACLRRFTDQVGFLRGHSTRVAELAPNASRPRALALGVLRGSRRGSLPRSRAGVGAERSGGARSFERGGLGTGSPPPLYTERVLTALPGAWHRSRLPGGVTP